MTFNAAEDVYSETTFALSYTFLTLKAIVLDIFLE